MQLAPERTTSVARTDATHARVLVTGLAGHQDSASRQYAISVARNRRLVARLQRHDPAVGGDLAWSSVDAVQLAVRGYASRPEDLVWVGELEADAVMEVRTRVGGTVDAGADVGADPGAGAGAGGVAGGGAGGGAGASTWRMRVEEWEQFPGDPAAHSDPQQRDAPVWEQRLVYADDIYL